MGTDGGHIGAVAGGKGIHPRPVEEQGVLQNHSAVQHQLGCDDAVGAGSAVDGTAHGGAELVLLEQHALDGVGEARAGQTVNILWKNPLMSGGQALKDKFFSHPLDQHSGLRG